MLTDRLSVTRILRNVKLEAAFSTARMARVNVVPRASIQTQTPIIAVDVAMW